MAVSAASSASRPAIIAAHLYRRERKEKSLTQRKKSDFHCLPSSLSSDNFKIVVRALKPITAPSASMNAFIASHQVRREWMAELIIAEIFFAARQRDRRGAGERGHDKTGTADSAFPAESAVPVCLSPYLIISYIRLIRRLNNDDQPGFDVGLDFHKFISHSK